MAQKDNAFKADPKSFAPDFFAAAGTVFTYEELVEPLQLDLSDFSPESFEATKILAQVNTISIMAGNEFSTLIREGSLPGYEEYFDVVKSKKGFVTDRSIEAFACAAYRSLVNDAAKAGVSDIYTDCTVLNSEERETVALVPENS